MSDQSDPTQEELTNGILSVKASDARSVILRELLREQYQRPVDFKDIVMEESGTSQANVYDSLNTLAEKGVLEKMSGDSKTTLYSVTELGEAVADRLGITPEDHDQQPNPDAAEPDAPGGPLDPDNGRGRGFAMGGPDAATDDSEDDSENVSEIKSQIREVVDEHPESVGQTALNELAEEYDGNE
ncbi:hypothetical protein [Haloarcula sediminis]|uniref:hypothetical protein n=1 Tax=Haloarcula sediminis TaxID=3111777 RepID=UPI002D78CD0E|nr:hypothetical protein [Haloarcula sp. CK38]